MTTPLRAFLRSSLLAGIAGVTCASATEPATGDAPPVTVDGSVTLSGGTVAAGVGYKWGHGTLSYKGQDIAFCVRGLSLGDVGAARLTASGPVYNLKSPDDFFGKYFAVSVGVALVRGESATILKNNHGVMMELELREVGVRINMATTGVKIVSASDPQCKAAQPRKN